TMRGLADTRPAPHRDRGIGRTVGLAIALVAPSVMATLSPPPTVWNALFRMAVSTLLAVMVVARVARASHSRAQAELATRHRATHDALTELPNRELLAE